jgi:hypothetical protein
MVHKVKRLKDARYDCASMNGESPVKLQSPMQESQKIELTADRSVIGIVNKLGSVLANKKSLMMIKPKIPIRK